MKIKRYVAKDMRTALAQIKEELGADAVIMSNKKIPEGVELMAAVDYSTQAPSAQQEAPSDPATSASSEAELRDDVVRLSSGSSASAASQSIGQAMPSAEATTPADSPADSLAALLSRNVQQTQNPAETDISHASETPDLEAQLKQFTQKLASQSSGVSQTETSSAAHSVEDNESELDGFETQAPSSFKQPELVNSAQTQQASLGDTPSQTGAVSIEAFEQMKSEMASIRQLLEHQVSGLMWQDLAQKEPSRAMLIDRLQAMGITEELADQIAGYVPTNLPADEAWEAALTLLSHQINTTNNDIIHRGGIVSLVGPTGVGKTTTLAKLAARFAQVHGADELALISTDTYRIGGFEQLETYGKIIGCQVHLAKDAQALETLVQQLSSKKLILIDTAGMGQRDMRLAEHLSTLVSNTRIRIRNYLVLAANTQHGVMQENVERFKKIPLCGCIFTKLDESLSMGEIIATSVQNGLPIGYLTDGQRVPEDIKVANAEKLVSLAEKIANKSAMKFSFVANRQPMAAAAFG